MDMLYVNVFVCWCMCFFFSVSRENLFPFLPLYYVRLVEEVCSFLSCPWKTWLSSINQLVSRTERRARPTAASLSQVPPVPHKGQLPWYGDILMTKDLWELETNLSVTRSASQLLMVHRHAFGRIIFVQEGEEINECNGWFEHLSWWRSNITT